MAISIYSTLTREKKPFQPVVPGKVGIYLCGPTVYKPSHIGHAVGPIIFDAVKRYLTHSGYLVTWVVNVTDVDDKLIAEAARQNTTTMALAAQVTEDYLAAMKALRVEGIDHMPRASEHIGGIIVMIKTLIDRGFAYDAGGDVYFEIAKDDDYGKLSNRRTEEQEGQRELVSGGKRNPGDFALWKAAKPDEPAEVKFDSPWGKGRPGWHIECSAMAASLLGQTFDIHGGGMDLIFPHHENEIAQSESANGKPFARYWMHNGLTRINTKKISKSDADPEMQAALTRMTLSNLLKAVSGDLLRFFVLSTHYRRPIEYSDAELESRRKALDGFHRLWERIERLSGASPLVNFPKADRDFERMLAPTSDPMAQAARLFHDAFHSAMDDDFNTAGAMAAMFDFASTINRFIDERKLEAVPDASACSCVSAAGGMLVSLGNVLGLFQERFGAAKGSDDVADRVMQVLISIRQHLRKKKDFESADLLRTLLSDKQITLEDRPDGTSWRAEG